MTKKAKFLPGNLVKARSRVWVVQSESTDEWLRLRPVGGSDDQIVQLMPELEEEEVTQAVFPQPNPEKAGAFNSARLFYNALRFLLRNGTGPFRSFGSISIIPHSYQFVPLLMAMRQKVVRLLIADDVGVGKTVEAGLIVREMLDRGDIKSFAVLCPPHLVDQWVDELKNHFNLNAEALNASTAKKIEKKVPYGYCLTESYPYLVVSLDYIKSERHYNYLKAMKVDMLVVDEAHTCVKSTKNEQKRYALIESLLENRGAEEQDPLHLLMLTATPHSGKDDTFYRLLSLLDPIFAEDRDISTKNQSLRTKLAQHFVQRRRSDIQSWRVVEEERATGFPIRYTTEKTYDLTQPWIEFFTTTQKYCQGILAKAEKLNEKVDISWYSTLALFQCIASSPCAAINTLKNRLNLKQQKNDGTITYDVDQEDGTATTIGAALTVSSSITEDGQVKDRFAESVSDESLATESDIEPIVEFDEVDNLNTLISLAENLKGAGKDPKLDQLLIHVTSLLKDGFNPVIFCRFISTAHYIKDELRKHFNDDKNKLKKLADGLVIDCVTGEYVPEERKAKVLDLTNAKKRILVATDCLSEGINLQQSFTAVVHYDLAWNPTRHEQREGRIDRFGQLAPQVRCTMLYSTSNPVDALILEVILRKSAAIKKELGVVVPVPEQVINIDRELIKAVLFKKPTQAKQGSLLADIEFTSTNADFDFASLLEENDTAWHNTLEKIKSSRTIFAQNSIKPEDIKPLWEKQQEVLGSYVDLEKFAKDACACFEARLTKVKENDPQDTRYKFPVDDITFEHLRKSMLEEKFTHNCEINFEQMHRSSPFINVLAENIVEQAINNDNLNISRCGVGETHDIEIEHKLYLLRLRYQMRVAYKNQTKRNLMVEEILPVTVAGKQNLEWNYTANTIGEDIRNNAAVKLLLNSTVSGNFNADLSQKAVQEALDLINSQDSLNKLQEIAYKRAELLQKEHTDLKKFTAEGSVVEVTPCIPVDVMGVYVLFPALF